MAMRDEIYKAIMEGGATKESLLELTGTTEKGLASQFTYLRMTGKCPMKQDDGTFKIVSAEEWEEHRASSGGKSEAALTPEERVEKAEKRSKRAQSAFDNAQKRADANPDDELAKLKLVKADAELRIAEIELGKAESGLEDMPTLDVVDGETEDGIEDGGIEDDGFEDLE